MDLGIRGKNALVLASSKGLGKATAIALAAEGANVTICGRDIKALQEVEDAISPLDGHVHSVVTDLNDKKDRSNLVSAARERFGAIDILVTNSGGPSAGVFEDFQSDDWRSFFDLTSRRQSTKLRGHVAGPTDKVVQRVKRLLRYLQGSIDFRLVFTGATSQMDLQC